MAGIFFEVFLLLAAMATIVTLFAFWKQKAVVLPVAVILFVLGGGLLLTSGLQYESGTVYAAATGVTTYTFTTITAAEDISILLTGLGFVAIGIIVSIMFLKLYASGGEG